MGVKYCKESELTLSRLLSYERSKGRISECLELVRITVTTLDGKTTTHTLDSEHHTVRDLKFLVEEEGGSELHTQRRTGGGGAHCALGPSWVSTVSEFEKALGDRAYLAWGALGDPKKGLRLRRRP